MTCCLMAPSHYLNQCWPIITCILSNSAEQFHNNCSWLIHDMCSNNTLLKLLPHLPGANELTIVSHEHCTSSRSHYASPQNLYFPNDGREFSLTGFYKSNRGLPLSIWLANTQTCAIKVMFQRCTIFIVDQEIYGQFCRRPFYGNLSVIWKKSQHWLLFSIVIDMQQHNFTHFWPSGATWQHRCESTLAQVKACCLTAPSHYLN